MEHFSFARVLYCATGYIQQVCMPARQVSGFLQRLRQHAQMLVCAVAPWLQNDAAKPVFESHHEVSCRTVSCRTNCAHCSEDAAQAVGVVSWRIDSSSRFMAARGSGGGGRGGASLGGGTRSYSAKTLCGNWEETRYTPGFEGAVPSAETEKAARERESECFACVCLWRSWAC